MRTLWNIVAVIAVANVLAFGAFAGWLVASDRLDVGRLREVRAMLTKTIAQSAEESKAAEQKAEADRRAAEEAAKAARVPMTAAEKLAARGEATELDHQRAERLKREIADLQRQVSGQLTRLQQERARLDEDRLAFEQAVQGSQQSMNDAQFQKTLGVLSTLKPAEATAVLRQMLLPVNPIPGDTEAFAPIAGTTESLAANTPGSSAASAPAAGSGVSAAGMATVVSYLDAMDEKPRGKIISEIVKTDPKLATELLEAMRRRAQFARASQDPP